MSWVAPRSENRQQLALLLELFTPRSRLCSRSARPTASMPVRVKPSKHAPATFNPTACYFAVRCAFVVLPTLAGAAENGCGLAAANGRLIISTARHSDQTPAAGLVLNRKA